MHLTNLSISPHKASASGYFQSGESSLTYIQLIYFFFPRGRSIALYTRAPELNPCQMHITEIMSMGFLTRVPQFNSPGIPATVALQATPTLVTTAFKMSTPSPHPMLAATPQLLASPTDHPYALNMSQLYRVRRMPPERMVRPSQAPIIYFHVNLPSHPATTSILRRYWTLTSKLPQAGLLLRILREPDG